MNGIWTQRSRKLCDQFGFYQRHSSHTFCIAYTSAMCIVYKSPAALTACQLLQEGSSLTPPPLTTIFIRQVPVWNNFNRSTVYMQTLLLLSKPQWPLPRNTCWAPFFSPPFSSIPPSVRRFCSFKFGRGARQWHESSNNKKYIRERKY